MSRKYQISQNFLRSPKLALMLVGHTNIKKRDLTLDFGAGSGVFTYALSKKSGQVIALEIDDKTFIKLQQNTKNLPNVNLKHTDILKFDLESLPKDYKICANPPFHLSAKIITKISLAKNQPASAYFIFQRQFARKLIASRTNFTSCLGAQIYPFFESKIKKPLKKSDFTPPPAVDTVFFEMKRRQSPLIDSAEQNDYQKFIEQMFTDYNFYTKNCLEKFKSLKPSQLDGNDWLEIWRNFC